jgi:hypothetical protein
VLWGWCIGCTESDVEESNVTCGQENDATPSRSKRDMLNTNKRTMPAETKPCPRHHRPRHSPVRRTWNVVVPALFLFLAPGSARIARVDRTVSCLFKMLAFLDAYCPHTIYAARRWTFAWYVAL